MVAPRPSRGKSWVLAMLAPNGGCAWLRSRRRRRICHGPRATAGTMPGRDEGTGALIEPRNYRACRRLAVTVVRRLQSSTQSWVRLIKPHTQKFGHSLLRYPRDLRDLIVLQSSFVIHRTSTRHERS